MILQSEFILHFLCRVKNTFLTILVRSSSDGGGGGGGDGGNSSNSNSNSLAQLAIYCPLWALTPSQFCSW
jgi:hypothetical protein